MLGWTTLPKKDPIRHAAATLKRWAKEWWLTTDKSSMQAGTIGPGELSKAYHAAQGRLEGSDNAGGKLETGGPVADACCWAREVGWQLVSPGIMVDGRGDRLSLTVALDRAGEAFQGHQEGERLQQAARPGLLHRGHGHPRGATQVGIHAGACV